MTNNATKTLVAVVLLLVATLAPAEDLAALIKSGRFADASARARATIVLTSIDDATLKLNRRFLYQDLHAARVEKYGEAYAARCRIREAVDIADYQLAIDGAQQIPGLGPLYQESQIIAIDAMIASGKLKEARTIAKELNGHPQMRLYQGELLLRLAELAYLDGDRDHQIKAALGHLDAIPTWSTQIRPQLANVAAVPTGALDERVHPIDDAAVAVLRDYPAGDRLRLPADEASPLDAVINAADAEWYLDALLVRAELLRVAIEIQHDSSAAHSAIERAAATLRQHKQPRPELQNRLRLAIDEGAFLIPSRHWSDTRSHRQSLRLATYHAVAGDPARARLHLATVTSLSSRTRPTDTESAIHALTLASIAPTPDRRSTALTPFRGPLKRHALIPLADYLSQLP